ncbi:MAG: heavy-metal-associated domain-containing protein, partial [Campylobacterota bacterium]|nr:heavy-metal-associated domain-containing protein [Campylobacterota bacterium]
MKKILKVENIKCNGCANTLKKALFADYGEIEVNLEKTPREITLNIDEEQLNNLKYKLRTLGYPLTTDKLSTLQTINTKAKSFVSCAIG